MAYHTPVLHPAIVVRRAGTIEGAGLIATAPIARGEIIASGMPGPVVTLEEMETGSPERRDLIEHYGFQCGVNQHCLPEDDFRELNHSCDPNTWWNGNDTLVARRDIHPDDEICYDYATCDIDYFFEMDCNCGAAKCRGKLTNSDFLDPAWQAQYGDHLPPHVLDAIKRSR